MPRRIGDWVVAGCGLLRSSLTSCYGVGRRPAVGRRNRYRENPEPTARGGGRRKKGRTMRSRVRSVAGVVVALAIVVMLPLQAQSKPLTLGSVQQLSASHQCLVLAGSGDPAFVRNFNPYTAT